MKLKDLSLRVITKHNGGGYLELESVSGKQKPKSPYASATLIQNWELQLGKQIPSRTHVVEEEDIPLAPSDSYDSCSSLPM